MTSTYVIHKHCTVYERHQDPDAIRASQLDCNCDIFLEEQLDPFVSSRPDLQIRHLRPSYP